MANDKEYDPQQQPASGGDKNDRRDRREQFNELSELSLEERMAVADRIGIPVKDAGEAAATGTASGVADLPEDVNTSHNEEANRR